MVDNKLVWFGVCFCVTRIQEVKASAAIKSVGTGVVSEGSNISSQSRACTQHHRSNPPLGIRLTFLTKETGWDSCRIYPHAQHRHVSSFRKHLFSKRGNFNEILMSCRIWKLYETYGRRLLFLFSIGSDGPTWI